MADVTDAEYMDCLDAIGIKNQCSHQYRLKGYLMDYCQRCGEVRPWYAR